MIIQYVHMHIMRISIVAAIALLGISCHNKPPANKISSVKDPATTSLLKDSIKSNDTLCEISNDTMHLPFIGVKHFETRHGVSGSGTPGWLVEIKKNRDVFFYFVQINQGDGKRTVTKGKYYAGKFKEYMKCDFKQWDDFPRYYVITKDTIFEVDRNHNRLYLIDCCAHPSHKPCACQGGYFMLNTDTFVHNIK